MKDRPKNGGPRANREVPHPVNASNESENASYEIKGEALNDPLKREIRRQFQEFLQRRRASIRIAQRMQSGDSRFEQIASVLAGPEGICLSLFPQIHRIARWCLARKTAISKDSGKLSRATLIMLFPEFRGAYHTDSQKGFLGLCERFESVIGARITSVADFTALVRGENRNLPIGFMSDRNMKEFIWRGRWDGTHIERALNKVHQA